MSGFEVEPALLRSGGDQVIGVAERFLAEVEGFEARMQGYGEPWGGDDIGSLIGTAYTAVSAWVLDCIGTAVEEVGAAGSDLTLMADGYEATEQDVAQGMDSLRGTLG